MAIFETFKKRMQRNRGEVPDVFQYVDVPQALRVQIVHIMFDALGDHNEYSDHYGIADNVQKAYRHIVETLRREMGVFLLPPTKYSNDGYHQELADFILAETDVENFLSAVELICQVTENVVSQDWYRRKPNAMEVSKKAIEEINYRFRWHGFGYEYNDEIIKIESELVHAEAVRPALQLLANKRFTGAHEEFLKAYEHYRKGKHEEALNDALKSLESTLKTILDKRAWVFDPQRDTASKLIQIAIDNNLIPAFWQSHFNGLRLTLEAGVPTARNKLAGHGQGTSNRDVPAHLVAYVLHLTASAIVFLVRSEQALS